MWVKVFGAQILNLLGMKSQRFEKLDLPTPYPWEYAWCFSVIPVIMALLSLPRNKVWFRFLFVI